MNKTFQLDTANEDGASQRAEFQNINTQSNGAALAVVWGDPDPSLSGTSRDGGFYLIDEGLENPDRKRDPICFARFRSFPVPGGGAYLCQPRCAAMGLLWEIFGGEFSEVGRNPAFKGVQEAELQLIRQMLANQMSTSLTCSPAMLFDAVASISGVRHELQFVGQAIPDLEHAALPHVESEHSFRLLEENGLLIVDWEPMILQLIEEYECCLPLGRLIAAFQNTMAEIIVAVAKRANLQKVVLSGRCFLNHHLAERSITRLREENFRPILHRTSDFGEDFFVKPPSRKF